MKVKCLSNGLFPMHHKSFVVMLIFFLGTLRSVAFCGDLFRYDPDISGKIFNHDTRSPMKGVVVSAVWFFDQVRFSEASKREYYDYFETVTDQEGNFRIPGKGFCVIRNIYPPTISILKAGYSVLNLPNLVVNSGQKLPSGDEVTWVDGNLIILFRKKSLEERKSYLQTHKGVPFSQMFLSGVPYEKVRLYMGEVNKEYGGGVMAPAQLNVQPLRSKKGGIFPAEEKALKRKARD